MIQKEKRIYERVLVLCSLLFCSLAMGVCLTGCPSDGTGGDGGTVPEGSNVVTSCETGQTCLTIDNDKVRACDVLLTGEAPADAKVQFTKDLRGAHAQRGKLMSLSFAWRSDATLNNDGSIAILPATSWSVTKVSCHDSQGNRIETPKLSIVKR